jgi:hypothetical protein
MISNNTDLYDLVRSLSAELKQAGEEQWSSRLIKSLSNGTMPGEILGDIRLLLRELYDSDVSQRLNQRSRIKEALKQLDRALRPSFF